MSLMRVSASPSARSMSQPSTMTRAQRSVRMWVATTSAAAAVSGPGWPGPLTAAAAEVVATHVLTDLCARVIVDGWDIDRALGEADTRIRDIYANVPSR